MHRTDPAIKKYKVQYINSVEDKNPMIEKKGIKKTSKNKILWEFPEGVVA